MKTDLDALAATLEDERAECSGQDPCEPCMAMSTCHIQREFSLVAELRLARAVVEAALAEHVATWHSDPCPVCAALAAYQTATEEE